MRGSSCGDFRTESGSKIGGVGRGKVAGLD